MALHQLDTENADRNITSLITVLTDSPAVSGMCVGLIKFGDGTKNLNGTGGDFSLVITVGGQTVQPSPQTITFSTAVRASVWTTPFPVVAGDQVIIRVLSPNAADSDVDITAYLYDMTHAMPDAVAGASGGLPTTNGTKVSQTVDLTASQEIVAQVNLLIRVLVNKILITEVTGNTELFTDAGVSAGTVAAAYTSIAGVTKREALRP